MDSNQGAFWPGVALYQIRGAKTCFLSTPLVLRNVPFRVSFRWKNSIFSSVKFSDAVFKSLSCWWLVAEAAVCKEDMAAVSQDGQVDCSVTTGQSQFSFPFPSVQVICMNLACFTWIWFVLFVRSCEAQRMLYYQNQNLLSW